MNRRPVSTIVALFGVTLLAGTALTAAADKGDKGENAHAKLRGYEEVPAVSTAASGDLRLKIHDSAGMIEYELSYQDLQGAVTQSHIHFGQRGVAAGISVWLCGTATNPGPAGTPTCPSPGGTISGVLTSAQVIGPTAQLITAGEIDELIRAIRHGVAYANVHSTAVPGGEIRGQIHD